MRAKNTLLVSLIILPILIILLAELATTWPITTLAVGNTYPISITKVVLRDEAGKIETQFRRGDFVFVDITVKGVAVYAAYPYYYYYYIPPQYYYYYYGYYYVAGVQRILVLARATHGYTMWGLGAFAYNITQGETIQAMPAFKIPENAPTGKYKVTVYVWSNWAKFGGVPLAEPVSVEFEVV